MPTKDEIMAKMDAAKDVARGEIGAWVVKYPEAAKSLGTIALAHKPDAGYKRLGELVVALG